jgi:D-alanyl-D-alanine carboxypeptidase
MGLVVGSARTGFAFGPVLGLDGVTPPRLGNQSILELDLRPDRERWMSFRRTRPRRAAILAAALCAVAGAAPALAASEAMILVEVDSGKVLHADKAAQPWYPASITKIMTAYVVLRAVREGRTTLDTLYRVSSNAALQAPTKMGFAVGTTVTVDNAIKMLMVKSANDIAVVLAEGVSGSVENFADEMNRQSKRLGMTQSHWVNPNGLPADNQVTSARDMAILARAVLKEFPQYNYYWSLPGIRMGKRVHRNHNNLMGRYVGTDGMKTGFICASGFNVVATATRNNKRLIAVVLGSQSPAVRAVRAAQLFERGFQVTPLSWLTPGLGHVDAMKPVNVDPPNLRDSICGKGRRRPPSEEAENEPLSVSADSPYAVFLSSLQAPPAPGTLFQDVRLGEPVVVFTGPPKGSTQVADAKAKGKKGAQPQVASAAVAGVPWTALSPSALAHNPPSDLVTADGAISTVPLPRARPKRTAAAPAPKATAPKATAPKAKAKPKATKKANAKQ